jgi:hypothetical protein
LNEQFEKWSSERQNHYSKAFGEAKRDGMTHAKAREMIEAVKTESLKL